MPADKAFLDTNILIYAYDRSAGKKHELASELVVGLWNTGLGCISTQVLQEFFINITGKIGKPLDIQAAKEIVTDLLKWDVVINDGDSILGAINIQTRWGFSFWDSLIVHAATTSSAALLFSEDFSHGQVINDLEIRNPFLG